MLAFPAVPRPVFRLSISGYLLAPDRRSWAIHNLSPAVTDETVKAARDFLRTHPKEMPARTGPGKRGMEVPIAKFLACVRLLAMAELKTEIPTNGSSTQEPWGSAGDRFDGTT